MKLVKLKNVEVPDLPDNVPEYAERKTPPNMPRLHMLCAVVGSRNSGKTTTALRLMKMYVKAKSYDKIFWWSPTAKREAKFRSFMSDCEKLGVEIEVKETFNESDFLALQNWMRGEIDEYRHYKKQLEVWNKFCKVHSTDDMSLDELSMLEEMEWDKPTTTYKNGFPSFCLCWDDCIGDKSVFSPTCKGTTSQFWILHRHLSCSVLILSQIVANGIPRQIRGNISLWILFSCKSDKLKKEVSEELAFKVSPEKMLEMWEFATKERHNFLMCDYDCPDETLMFRKNFDQLLIDDI